MVELKGAEVSGLSKRRLPLSIMEASRGSLAILDYSVRRLPIRERHACTENFAENIFGISWNIIFEFDFENDLRFRSILNRCDTMISIRFDAFSIVYKVCFLSDLYLELKSVFIEYIVSAYSCVLVIIWE